MKIEELTPEYIFNKIQDNHTSKVNRDIDLSVGGKDIRFLDKSDPNKHKSSDKLKKVELDMLPKYIKKNYSSFKDWIA